MRTTLVTLICLVALVTLIPTVALAHSHYGNSNVSVTPTEDVAPGDTVSVSFDYRIWHHHSGWQQWCPWEVLLDGTLLASGGFWHPAYNQTITFNVSTTVTIPDDASDGEHTIQIRTSVAPGWYWVSSYVTINVEADNTPPVIESVSADPAELWPPNHKMVEVTVTATVTDDVDPNPTWQIVDVHCDEPEDIVGAGNHAPDWEITGDDTVELRAERSGTGDGREYHILIEATDAAGNTATAEVVVTVAHDQGKGKK